MDCRPGCGACCTAPSISSPLPGMPFGKAAGVRCANLDDANRCLIWNTPAYPKVCQGFRPELSVCGDSASEAVRLIDELERLTQPSRRNINS